MLAGAHGIDAVALIVAADEGVMPQTREHLAICTLLGIERGVVVLTKADLADADTLRITAAAVAELVAGTALAVAPVVAVSARSGSGLDELRGALDLLAEALPERDAGGLLRLPIDRVFSIRGFGTVVTGTLRGGTLRVGDTITALPGGRTSRVRGLEVHGGPVAEAAAGTRVAVNLTDLAVDELARGQVLGSAGALVATSMCDVLVSVLGDAAPLRADERVRVHAGSAERLARVRLLGAESIGAGESGVAQLRLELPAVMARGDRLVMRRYSPAATIAGARVLDPLPPKRSARDRPWLVRAAALAEDDVAGAVCLMLEEAGGAGRPLDDLAAATGRPVAGLETMTANRAEVVRAGRRLVAATAFAAVTARATAALEAFHASSPLAAGMPRRELARAVQLPADGEVFAAVLAALDAAGVVAKEGERLRLAGHSVRFSAPEERLRGLIEAAATAAGLRGITRAELLAVDPDHTAVERVSQAMRVKGTLRPVGNDALVHCAPLESLKAAVRRNVRVGGKLDVAELKEMTGLSRKYAIPLLEFLDRERVTRRVGAERFVLGAGLVD